MVMMMMMMMMMIYDDGLQYNMTHNNNILSVRDRTWNSAIRKPLHR